MKKLLSLTLAFCLLLALAACGSGSSEPEPTPEPTLEPAPEATAEPETEPTPEEDPGLEEFPPPDEALAAMVEDIYAICPAELMCETVALDPAGPSAPSFPYWAAICTGLSSDQLAFVDKIIISQPMNGSQAYSLVLLRLKDAADLEPLGQALLDNAPVGRWYCVIPDAVTVGGCGDVLCAVMADDELGDADALVDAFFSVAGGSDLLLETDEVNVADTGLLGIPVPDGEGELG